MKRKEIRFAVGEFGNQLSPVWKIWNQKNDVYLTGRFTGGAFKISLHASGVWPVAATTDSGIEIKPGNRRMKTWKRPSEFKKGWTWGPQIAVPRMVAADDFIFDEKQTRQIEWIPKPEENSKVTIAILFAASGVCIGDIVQVCGKGDAYSDEYLELENGEKIFIMARYEPLSESDYECIQYLESEAKLAIDANPEGVTGVLNLFMQGADVPYVYTYKFGTSGVN